MVLAQKFIAGNSSLLGVDNAFIFCLCNLSGIQSFTKALY